MKYIFMMYALDIAAVDKFVFIHAWLYSTMFGFDPKIIQTYFGNEGACTCPQFPFPSQEDGIRVSHH
jgi:hypothetical protein